MGKAGAVKRRQIELATLYSQSGAPLADRIQAWVRLRKTHGLAFGRRAEAIHIVMAIALDVCNAQAGRQQGVLLYGQPGLTGQVFA